MRAPHPLWSVAISACALSTADAQQLDPAFGEEGWTQTDFTLNTETPFAMQRTAEGKFLIGGRLVSVFATEDNKLFFARFDADGFPDATFSQDGYVMIDPCIGPEKGTAILQHSDGRAYMTGSEQWSTQGPPDQASTARVSEAGVQDMSYGDQDGWSYMLVEGDETWTLGLEEGADGGVTLLGQYGDLMEADLYMTKYTPDGQEDQSFGTYGIRILEHPDDPDIALYGAHAVPAGDGGFVFCGSVIGEGMDDWDIALSKVLPDGSFDPAFGQGGWVHPGMPWTNYAQCDLLLDAQGRPLVTVSYPQNGLIRFSAEGERDLGFGNGGMIPTGDWRLEAHAVAVDAAGRILICTGDTLRMYDEAGQPVTAFGTNGSYDLPETWWERDSKAFLVPTPTGVALAFQASGGIQLLHVIYDPATGMASAASEQRFVQAFPNPAADKVEIRIPAPGPVMVELLDAQGRPIRRSRSHTGDIRSDVSDLPVGIYTMRCSTAQGAWIVRVVKQ